MNEWPSDFLRRRQAKVFAAEQRTTLKDVLVQALQRFMATPPEAEEKQRKVKGARLLAALQATNTEPMVPLKREEIYDRPTRAGGSSF